MFDEVFSEPLVILSRKHLTNALTSIWWRLHLVLSKTRVLIYHAKGAVWKREDIMLSKLG